MLNKHDLYFGEENSFSQIETYVVVTQVCLVTGIINLEFVLMDSY